MSDCTAGLLDWLFDAKFNKFGFF